MVKVLRHDDDIFSMTFFSSTCEFHGKEKTNLESVSLSLRHRSGDTTTDGTRDEVHVTSVEASSSFVACV